MKVAERVFDDDEPSVRIEITYLASIIRRGRGIYLANWSEDRNGTEDWDAFPTLARAKRWCAEGCGGRLSWEQDGERPIWHGERTEVITEDDVY